MTRDSGYALVLRAEVGRAPLWTLDGMNVAPHSLPLSDRLLVALHDWRDFFDDVGGAVSDADVVEEFVGQGFKIAHALRRELKGSTVWYAHPVTGEAERIVHRTAR